MNKTQIVYALKKVADAREAHAARISEYQTGLNAVMRRLLHEAMAARMSPEEVARLSGFTTKQIRSRMRIIGLSPSNGKTVLSQMAAEALANNAALLGVDPEEINLMSPLAYLPMGEQMRRRLQDQTVSQVHEVEPDVHGVNYWDDEIGCGTPDYEIPLLISGDLNKITCKDCRAVLVRKGYDE